MGSTNSFTTTAVPFATIGFGLWIPSLQPYRDPLRTWDQVVGLVPDFPLRSNGVISQSIMLPLGLEIVCGTLGDERVLKGE